MTTKSTTQSPKPKASAKSKSAAKPKAAAAAKPRSAAKSAAPKAKSAAKATSKKSAAKATSKKSATKKAAGPDPIEVVKPLIRVRQTRAFTSKKVTRAELDAITEVARWSGSSRNEQPCRFITLRDKNRIREIAEIGLPQTRGLPTASAAVAIIEPNEPERGMSRSFDDGRAAERMLIAAHLLGLGGGISRVRADVREGINKLLRLPANRSVRTIVAFGHPTEEALAPKSQPGKARLPREEVVYDEYWPDPPLKD